LRVCNAGGLPQLDNLDRVLGPSARQRSLANTLT
jgi:hypothetical protein